MMSPAKTKNEKLCNLKKI